MAKGTKPGTKAGLSIRGVKPMSNAMGSQPKLSAKIGGVTNASKGGRSYPK